MQFLFSPQSHRTAWILWGVLFGIVATMSALQPYKKTVTPVYRQAVADWDARENMYDSSGDRLKYHYPPQFAVLYMPITWLPVGLGEAVWRAICVGLFATGVWRLANLPGTTSAKPYFLLMTILCVWVGMSSARNGQVNMLLAGLMTHIAADLAVQRWWSAAALMTIGIAFKPIILVMILLAVVFYRPLWGRLAVTVGMLAVLPYFFAPVSYVNSQYATMFQHVFHLRDIEAHWFCNLKGMLRCMGVELSHSGLTAIRLTSAVATLGICWLGYRIWAKEERAVYLLLMSALYLMLFNPITETNSYVILIPAVAVLAAWRWARDADRLSTTWLLVAGIGIGSDNFGNPIHTWTDLWMKCLLAIGMIAYVLVEMAIQARTNDGHTISETDSARKAPMGAPA